MEKIKRYIRDHETLMNILAWIYNIIGFNFTRGYRNLIYKKRGVFLLKSKVFNYGKNNTLIFEKGCRVENLKIQFFGDNNMITVDRDCVLKNVDIWISDGSTIEVGHNTHFTGQIHIACIEGRKVHIGERCLFSNQITLRTGDSHSILNSEGKRINYAEDIYIGNHVWVGQQVIILKGAKIGDQCVVGTSALVTGKHFFSGSVLAGIPARVIKNEVKWDHRLL